MTFQCKSSAMSSWGKYLPEEGSKGGLVLITLCWLKVCSKLPERQGLGVQFLYIWASKKAPEC